MSGGGLQARRSNDSVPRVALPFGSICNVKTLKDTAFDAVCDLQRKDT